MKNRLEDLSEGESKVFLVFIFKIFLFFVSAFKTRTKCIQSTRNICPGERINQALPNFAKRSNEFLIGRKLIQTTEENESIWTIHDSYRKTQIIKNKQFFLLKQFYKTNFWHWRFSEAFKTLRRRQKAKLLR